MISVFDYIDHLAFLRDAVQAQRQQQNGFSYRKFNRLAGVRSPGFLKLVMDGKRQLSHDSSLKIAKGLKLNEVERDYFINLVLFNQASSHEDKQYYFALLLKNKSFVRIQSLTLTQYKLFSHWYYVAILELLRLQSDELKNMEWLQRKLHPTVSLRDIKQALLDLKLLGFVTYKKTGGWRCHDACFRTPDEVESFYLVRFHQEMCRMAERAVTQDPASTREFSALTIALSAEGFVQAKRELQTFKKRLHELLEQENKRAKQVVAQINLQLFQFSTR